MLIYQDKLEENSITQQALKCRLSLRECLLEISLIFKILLRRKPSKPCRPCLPIKIFTLVCLNQVYFFDEETKKIGQNLQELGQFELKDGSLQTLAYSLDHLFEVKTVFHKNSRIWPTTWGIQRLLTYQQLRPRLTWWDYQEKGIACCKRSIIMVCGIYLRYRDLVKPLRPLLLTSQVDKESRVLILAPLPSNSLIYNWADEFQNLPHSWMWLLFMVWKLVEEILAESHQIYVTSYATFVRTAIFIREQPLTSFLRWVFIMKTPRPLPRPGEFCGAVAFARQEPDWNHLGELWSIFKSSRTPAKCSLWNCQLNAAQFIASSWRIKKKFWPWIAFWLEVVYKKWTEDQQRPFTPAPVATDARPSGLSKSDQEFQRSHRGKSVRVWCACVKSATPPLRRHQGASGNR